MGFTIMVTIQEATLPTTTQKGTIKPDRTAPRLRVMPVGVAGKKPSVFKVKSKKGMGRSWIGFDRMAPDRDGMPT